MTFSIHLMILHMSSMLLLSNAMPNIGWMEVYLNGFIFFKNHSFRLSTSKNLWFLPRFYDRPSPLGGHPLLHHHHPLECGFVMVDWGCQWVFWTVDERDGGHLVLVDMEHMHPFKRSFHKKTSLFFWGGSGSYITNWWTLSSDNNQQYVYIGWFESHKQPVWSN